jgi:hypothetical protein
MPANHRHCQCGNAPLELVPNQFTRNEKGSQKRSQAGPFFFFSKSLGPQS